MRQRFPVIVELLGPSGSGKSSLLREAAAGLHEAGWRVSPAAASLRPRAAQPVPKWQPLDDLAWRPFVRHCVAMAAAHDWLPSQAATALEILKHSCVDARAVHDAIGTPLVVHDELLLHRAFSLLPRSADWQADTEKFFALAPLPSAAVVVRAEPAVHRERLLARGLTNVYRGLTPAELDETLARSRRIADMAAELLRARGLQVLVIDSSGTVADAARELGAFLQQVARSAREEAPGEFLRREVIAASGSFQTRGRRHKMRTQGVAYGSMQVGDVCIAPEEAQRDTAARLRQFDIDAAVVAGKTALDIGCNAGAVLFELGKLGLAGGLGLEIDPEKVALARQVRNHLGLASLAFEVCDIDRVAPAALPKFDLVFALAVERHVADEAALYRLLGELTRETLFFEANGGTDLAHVMQALRGAGFTGFRDCGFSIDDRDPRNHNRRLLTARAAPATPA